jgi:hypothetical protein
MGISSWESELIQLELNRRGGKRRFLPDKLSLGEHRRGHLAKGGRSLSCACLDFSNQVIALTQLARGRYQRWGRRLPTSISRTYPVVGECLITFRFTAASTGRVLHAVGTWLCHIYARSNSEVCTREDYGLPIFRFKIQNMACLESVNKSYLDLYIISIF